MSFLKIIIMIILTKYIFGCAEKTTYYGKIITNEDLDLKVLNKNYLIDKFCQPSYVDSLSNKYLLIFLLGFATTILCIFKIFLQQLI